MCWGSLPIPREGTDTVNKIKTRINRRLTALLAVLAIGVTGLSSLAALTAQLTVTSTFESAVAELSGNGTATTATLFNGTILSPGVKNYAELRVANSGNVALTVSAPAPVKTGTIATDIEVAVVSANVNQDLTCDATAFTAGGVGANGWQSITGTYTVSWPSLSPGALNADDYTEYCFAARLPTGSTAAGNASIVQTFTGNE
jgi:hypothetical protein